MKSEKVLGDIEDKYQLIFILQEENRKIKKDIYNILAARQDNTIKAQETIELYIYKCLKKYKKVLLTDDSICDITFKQ